MYVAFSNIVPLIEDAESPSMRMRPGSNIQDVNHHLDSSIPKDLLESLRFDQIDDRVMNIKPGHVKTCRWLLGSTEYLEWRRADKLSEHHGFFWIKGKPGSGKSTLTKFVLMETKKSLRDTIVLSFFFNARGSHLEKNTIGLYRSLLVQLLEKPPASHHVWNLTSWSNRPLKSQLNANRQMLKQALAEAIRLLGQYSITTIIDALDECDEDEVRDMVAFFEKLGEDAISDGRMLHVLFSSRHYPHITIQRSVEMTLEHQQGHAQDIEKYLSSELKVGRGGQAEHLRKEVGYRSSGIFMWIILVVSILNKAIDHGQVHSLRRKLQEIPSVLNELFRNILTRDSQNLDAMKLCLQFVLFANRPLTREELYYAILSGTEPDDLSLWDPATISPETMDLFILSSSKGLAEITKSKHHIVQFFHESVRDILLKENGLGQLWTDLSANSVGLSQDRLKECCSKYMRSNIVGDLGITGDVPAASSPEAGVLRKNVSLQFPFLEYAVHNIFAHADIAHTEGVSQELFVKDFELSNWVQLNNIVEVYEVRRLPSDIDLLYVCAERNYANLTGILIQAGLYTSGQNRRYHNPIFAAVANNCRQAFEVLTRADSQLYPDGIDFPYPGVNVGSFLTKCGKSALMPQLMSVYNFDNTGTLRGGVTPLYWAAELGYTEVLQVLISKGADFNARGGLYGNALQAASREGHEKVVQLLLDNGADINVQNGHYGNALQAASDGGHEKVVQLLLDKGADVNARGGLYGNALYAASDGGHEKVVQLLLDNGADTNVQGGSPGNALQAASTRGHNKIIDMLVRHGADINVQGALYGSVLQAASAGAPTDSGYASITYNNVQYLSQAQSKDLMNIIDIVNPTDSSAENSAPEKKPPPGDTWNEEDYGSPADSMVYSDTSLPASTTDNYMSEFADELSCKVYNEELDVQVVKRVLKNLPERLKAFAFKIGSGPSTQIHRDVMYFVLKHRMYVYLLFGLVYPYLVSNVQA
jgi:ankyrin repeat protein